jgi:hypothetical protein
MTNHQLAVAQLQAVKAGEARGKGFGGACRRPFANQASGSLEIKSAGSDRSLKTPPSLVKIGPLFAEWPNLALLKKHCAMNGQRRQICIRFIRAF